VIMFTGTLQRSNDTVVIRYSSANSMELSQLFQQVNVCSWRASLAELQTSPADPGTSSLWCLGPCHDVSFQELVARKYV
jgi:hypothetical protein